MNTKTLIGALVGAILLFIWQFISWGLVNIHSGEQKYTVYQDSILSVLSDKLEEGTYFLPNVAQGGDKQAYEQYKKEYDGKPWAVVSYHKSMDMGMGMNMIRAFIADLLAVLFLIWVLTGVRDLSFSKSVLYALAIGLIGFLSVTYLNTIWFKNRAWDDLVDVLVSWGVVGVWLGWWLTRKTAS